MELWVLNRYAQLAHSDHINRRVNTRGFKIQKKFSQCLLLVMSLQ